MTNVATRLISVIMMLQSRGTLKAGELAEELGVSERTVHRYMGMLDELGIPIYSERGPYGGFSLVRGYKLPPLVFTPEEATALYLGAELVKDVWGASYRDAVVAATAKLDNVLPDALLDEVQQVQRRLVVTGWLRRDYGPWEPVLDDLRRSVARRRQISIVYRSFRQQVTRRIVDPYALALQWGNWYLVGLCHLRGNLRTFRVDRIEEVEGTGATFEVPPTFSARDYLLQMAQERPTSYYQVSVRFEPDVAHIVRERREEWQHLAEHDDGSVTLSFDAADLAWPCRWVLTYQDRATVLAPPELVRMVRDAARAIAARYDDTGIG
ncbi:MAG: YafY family transcriptional regulator [Anaerolineae bacterium]|nr:YafY family transcriptional regulator [Anaerolineae bacterium]